MLRGRRRLRTALMLTALGAATLAGCGDDAEDNALQIEMVDYAYEVSGSLEEGWTTFELSNTGDVYHMVAFGRLKDGVTLEDVQAALSGGGEGEAEEGPEAEGDGTDTGGTEETEGGGEVDEQSLGSVELISAQTDDSTTSSTVDPDTATSDDTTEDTVADTTEETTGDTTEETTDDTLTTQQGEEEPQEEGGEDPFEALFDDPEGTPGPPGGFYAPGESVTVTNQGLEAGEYALICFLQDGPEAPPHFEQGMVNSFTIAESDEPAGEEPEADVEIAIGDDSIEMPDELPSEETTYGITFEGGEHEFAFIEKLEEQATDEELEAYFAGFDEGALPTRETLDDGPAIFWSFFFSQAGDTTYYVTRSLEPGTWRIGCTLDESDGSDDGTGRDHFDTESKEVTVT